MDWLFSAREHVRMIPVERKTRTSILQFEAHAFNRDARAEAGVDALNPTGYIAFAIDDRQIDGVATGWTAVTHSSVRSLWIDPPSACESVVFGKQICNRD